jgi:glutaredoxin-like protein NrdH
MMITVYVTASCAQCMLTKKVLDAKGVEYRVVDVTASENALAYVLDDLGYSQAPVVVVSDEDHWSGFRPDLIARHIAA